MNVNRGQREAKLNPPQIHRKMNEASPKVGATDIRTAVEAGDLEEAASSFLSE